MTDTKQVFRKCRKGNVDEVINIINDNPDFDINSTNAFGDTLLFMACEYNLVQLVKFLLEQPNIDVNMAELIYGRTPLYSAVNDLNLDIVRLLLQHPDINVNIRTTNENKETVFFSFCYELSCLDRTDETDETYIEIMKLLLERDDIDINTQGSNGKTPFLKLCSNIRNAELINMLLDDDRTDIYKEDKYGYTPLMKLVEFKYYDIDENENQIKIIKKIMERYTDTDNSNNISNVNYINHEGLTAFHIACCKASKSVKILLEYNNIDFNKQDKHGKSPFYSACYHGDFNTVVMLLNDDRIDVNKADNHGLTPFHVACLRGCVEVVKLLLESDRITVTDFDLNISLSNDKKVNLCFFDKEIISLLSNNSKFNFDIDKYVKFMEKNSVKTDINIKINRCILNNNILRLKELMDDPAYDIINNNQHNNLFANACHLGSLDIIKMLFDDPRIDVNGNDGHGYIGLSHVIFRFREFAQTMLNDPRVDVNKYIKRISYVPESQKLYDKQHSRTLFNNMCRYKYDDSLYDMMINNSRVDLNNPDNKNRTPFYNACNHNRISVVKKLLNNDSVDVNICSYKGLSPFHAACKHLNVDIVKLLLESDRVKIPIIPIELFKIKQHHYNDDKYDELLKVLSEDDRPEVIDVVDKLKDFVG